MLFFLHQIVLFWHKTIGNWGFGQRVYPPNPYCFTSFCNTILLGCLIRLIPPSKGTSLSSQPLGFEPAELWRTDSHSPLLSSPAIILLSIIIFLTLSLLYRSWYSAQRATRSTALTATPGTTHAATIPGTGLIPRWRTCLCHCYCLCLCLCPGNGLLQSFCLVDQWPAYILLLES